jgi:hypothetical protein
MIDGSSPTLFPHPSNLKNEKKKRKERLERLENLNPTNVKLYMPFKNVCAFKL